jgi:beta-glucosidase
MAPLFFAAGILTHQDTQPLYKDPKAPIERRVEDLLGRMTLEEKVLLTHGKDDFDINDVPRLGIPSLTMSDGPLGARWGHSTAFPASIATASTWNVELMHRVGVALGQEFKHKGRAVALGPCVGIVRVPHGGRNFESFGEDPYLNGEMAAAYIQGEQSQKVASCVKHYALNNQEYERGDIDIRADERTMRELDLRVFEAAIKKGGAWSIMAAYNKVDGLHCSENPFLLQEVLKKDWGFQGFSVSDWGAVHSTVASANAGLDVEMPGPWGWWGEGKLLKAVQDGQVAESTIDDKARRVLRVLFWAGLFDEPRPQHDDEMVQHRAIALEDAREAVVLLKNDNAALPIDARSVKSIAVIGPYSDISFSGGGGSSHVDPFYSVTPLQGLKNRLGSSVKLVHVDALTPSGISAHLVDKDVVLLADDKGTHGLRGEYFANVSLAGNPIVTRVDKNVDFDWGTNSPAPGVPKERYGVLWTGKLKVAKTGTYNMGMVSDDGSRVYLDGKRIVDDWREHSAETHTTPVKLIAGQVHDLRIEYFNAMGIGVARFVCSASTHSHPEAVEAAKAADVAVVCVGTNEQFEGEGWDRPDFALSGEQAALIKEIAAANKRTVVVLIGGSQFLMNDWIGKVPAVVVGWYLGEEGGNALADVLLGKVNPSGKLPMSFVRSWKDHWAHDNYPGNVYTEGIYLGYRYLDHKNIRPQFPFGYGLSYTTFSYRGLKLEANGAGSWTASFRVKNTGDREGKEVAQLYVACKVPGQDRPPKELKGFAKVDLQPGQEKVVKIALGPDAFTSFDTAGKRWFAPAGTYSVLIGASSRDIRLQGDLHVAEALVQGLDRKL